MTDSEPRRIGVSIELKPHAYDPAANPELFEGVLARRLIAFVIDLIIIVDPGRARRRFSWSPRPSPRSASPRCSSRFLSPLFWPLIVIWALCYYG